MLELERGSQPSQDETAAGAEAEEDLNPLRLGDKTRRQAQLENLRRCCARSRPDLPERPHGLVRP